MKKRPTLNSQWLKIVDENDFGTTATLETLQQRARIIQRVRQYFDSRDFLEVETPLLSHDIVVDRYLEPIAIEPSAVGLGGETDQSFWLQTSPEFGMKRILASGATAIYQIAKAFRGGEVGQRHNPEFTMLEWYRCGDDQQTGIDFLGQFVSAILDTAPHSALSYRQAFERYAQLDPFTAPISDFAAAAQERECDVSALAGVEDIDAWRNLVLTEVIEPQLGAQSPEIIYDWPASQAALAVTRNEQHPVAERFELYYRAIELANGYHELLDADELIARNQAVNKQRVCDGQPPLPENSRLLSAMQHGLPACAGVALGIDRLVMLATGNNDIKRVMAFDFDRA